MADEQAPPPAAPASAVAAPPSAAKSGAVAAWLPVLAAIVLAPVATLAVAHFVLLPQLEARLGGPDAAASNTGPAVAPAKKGAATPGAKVISYRFENVVVNLAGTMGTRYLKATFEISGTHPNLIARCDAARLQLGDTTIAILSSLSLADLEQPGSKNIIRERLIEAFNRIFGERLVENLYFSEFVVQ